MTAVIRGAASLVLLALTAPRVQAQCRPEPFDHWLPDPAVDPSSFGLGVDVSGNWAIVGAHLEDSKKGVVYVYKRTGSEWSQHQKLVAPDDAINDEFGLCVAIDAETVVIGARREGAGSTQTLPGKAYVYVLNQITDQWDYTVRLAGNDSDIIANYGASVDVSGDTIVVGAARDSSTCAAGYCGAVYVYERPGAAWPAQAPENPLLATAVLKSDDPWHGEAFGSRVALDGDLLAVNAYFGTHQSLQYAGLVYLFERPAVGWSSGVQPSAKIGSAMPTQYGEFGVAVAVQQDSVQGDLVVIGARSQEIEGVEMGAAFVVEEPAGGWTALPYPFSADPNLLPSALSADDHYGLSVAIDGDRIVVSAPLEDTPDGQDWGRAYVFHRVCEEWQERHWLEAPSVYLDGTWPPHLGGVGGVAIQGTTVLVGVHLEDTSSGPDSGAVHVFQLKGCPIKQGVTPIVK